MSIQSIQPGRICEKHTPRTEHAVCARHAISIRTANTPPRHSPTLLLPSHNHSPDCLESPLRHLRQPPSDLFRLCAHLALLYFILAHVPYLSVQGEFTMRGGRCGECRWRRQGDWAFCILSVRRLIYLSVLVFLLFLVLSIVFAFALLGVPCLTRLVVRNDLSNVVG